jgi:cytochrome c-type biogenesis protein CcsB
VFYLLGALAAALAGAWSKTDTAQQGRGQRLFVGALVFAALGTVLHIAGMVFRIWIAGRPPVSNMYESVIWVSFGTMLFAWILYITRKARILITVSTAVAGILLIVADSAPAVMDPSIHPLVPVLRSNLWLTVHVLTITLGYAAFALTLGLGNVTLFHYLKGGAGNASRITALNDLTYRAMQFGVVLLAAGTLLGGVWADYSWGRFWGWDPKEVWALIALMGYIIILHARYTGWIGQFGFAALTVIGFTLVVMAWYGVNFVLGAGLHSYGFSAGGRGAVAFYTLLQFGYVGAVALLRKRRGTGAARAADPGTLAGGAGA